MFALYKALNASPLLEGCDITEFEVIFGMTTQFRVENSPETTNYAYVLQLLSCLLCFKRASSSRRVVNLKLAKTYTRTKPFDVSLLKPYIQTEFLRSVL